MQTQSWTAATRAVRAERAASALPAGLPLVPNGAGAMHTARQLYDPREPDLAALLDPDAAFPAEPFASDDGEGFGEGLRMVWALDPYVRCSKGMTILRLAFVHVAMGACAEALTGLALLGLRQSAGPDTLLDAARFVQRCAEKADRALAAAATAPMQGSGQPARVASGSAGEGGAAAVAAARDEDPQELADMALARGKARDFQV